MEVILQGKNVVSQIQAATSQIHSIAALKRLSAHEEVKEFWQKAEVIMAKVDWQSQNEALAGISNLTRSFTALQFTEFYASIPGLIQKASKAKENANKSARCLGAAGAHFAALSHEVEETYNKLTTDADRHKYWEARDAKESNVLVMIGHFTGPVTVGLGYLFWLPANKFRRRAKTHAQSMKIIKDVQGILRDKLGPVFTEASEAMDTAAEFFDNMAIKLNEVLTAGDEAAAAEASELHEHFLIMREVMKELRDAVQALSACVRREERRLE